MKKVLRLHAKHFALHPDSGLRFANLVQNYLRLGKLHEAQSTAEEARSKKLESPYLSMYSYQLAFVKKDPAGMSKQMVWSSGRAGVEDMFLCLEANSAAYFGQLAKARDLSRQAIDAARRLEANETAASYEANDALREALLGNSTEARQQASAALALAAARETRFGAALALAISGDDGRAQALAQDLERDYPKDTVVKYNYLPTIRAQLALNHRDFSQAVEILKIAAPFDLGQPGDAVFAPALYPVFVRAQAYLGASGC
jgi:eukaryotic-like serine/threonine-protein kinase